MKVVYQRINKITIQYTKEILSKDNLRKAKKDIKTNLKK